MWNETAVSIKTEAQASSKTVIARLDLMTQYPRAEVIEPEGRGVLDPPPSRGMTTEN